MQDDPYIEQYISGSFICTIDFNNLLKLFDDNLCAVHMYDTENGRTLGNAETSHEKDPRSEYIEFETWKIDYNTYGKDNPEYNFSCVIINKNIDEAKKIIQPFTETLGEHKIIHRIELYEDGSDGDLVGYFHYGWPQGEAEPALNLNQKIPRA